VTKLVWATFWAIFSQTRLVTLKETEPAGKITPKPDVVFAVAWLEMISNHLTFSCRAKRFFVARIATLRQGCQTVYFNAKTPKFEYLCILVQTVCSVGAKLMPILL
jgi:hypothetical protein